MPKLINPCGFAWPWQPLYAINPYLGCPFDCSYCWSKAMAHRFKREPPGGWRDVQSRYSMEELTVGYCLTEEATALSPRTILVGATCDPYPPLEKRLGITYFILRELQFANDCLAKEGRLPHKILVLTKSPIVCRDWELLKALGAWVGLSLTAPAGVDTGAWEPHAPSNASRIAALKFLHGEGVKTFASIEPWLIGHDPGADRFQEAFWDISDPDMIIQETHQIVDYYIVGSHNRVGKPIPALVPYYRAALPGVIATLRKLGRPFWIKPELKEDK